MARTTSRTNRWVAASLAALTLLFVGVIATPMASAATGSSYLCGPDSGYGCLAGTGYSGQSVWGSWGPGHNCVSYAAFRLQQNGSAKPWGGAIGNGYQWDENARAAGIRVDASPAVGSIAQWDGGFGHVAYVEVVTDSYIEISEDSYVSNTSGYSSRRRLERSGTTFTSAEFIHVKDVAGANDLYFVKTKNTGSGRVEAFTATAASGYSTGVSSATRFSPADEANGWFGLLPNTDLYFVKTKNTGSGKVEVHTATRASSYQSGISSAAPRFSPADANNGWFGLLPNTDLYFVKTKNTGSGKVEAFTATRASGYSTGVSSAVPRFSPADANNGWFGLLPNGDVYFVKTKNTGSGRVEAFTATAASGYQTGISSATRFSPGDASNGWFRMLPNNDVYFVKTRNTGSGKVEVHTATRASNYGSGISSAAPRFSPGDANNGWFGLLG